MRCFHSPAIALGVCVLVASAPVAFAKEKQQPPPQWAVDAAKTPTPATAKDSPAVILFDEYLITVDDQNRAVERERFAVRILKPQGRRYGDCAAYYDIDEKLNYFRSWTIAPDGHAFQAMDTDFTDHGEYDDHVLQSTGRLRSVKPPASDPGAVVVCETEQQLRPYMSEEFWQLQLPIPVVYQALELALPPGGHFAASWHAFAPVQPTELPNNHLRWEVKDMPALDLENIHATPNRKALEARASIHWGDSAVKGTDNQWHAIGLWQQHLEEHRSDPTPEITAKAQELVAGAPDLYTKLSRITSYLQKNIRYFVVERGIGGWQPHPAADIFRNRYGDCKDKTTLLIAMLRAIDISAHSFSVDSHRGFIDPAAPSRFGNHMITAIELPKGESDPRLMAHVKTASGTPLLIFDPTDEETPVGLIRAELQGGWGYLADGADSQVLQMPVLPPASAGVSRKGSFTLAADGDLTGDLTEIYSGNSGSSERGIIKSNDSKELREELERRLGSDLPGLTFKGYEFSGAADLDKSLNLDLHLAAATYAHAAGPLLLVRPRILGSHANPVPEIMEGKPRLYPIEIGHPGRWHDSFDIALPPGYMVDETPDSIDIDLDFASYHSAVTATAKQLHYERDYVVREVEIPASKADGFRTLQNAILTDERSTAVLKKQ